MMPVQDIKGGGPKYVEQATAYSDHANIEVIKGVGPKITGLDSTEITTSIYYLPTLQTNKAVRQTIRAMKKKMISAKEAN